MPVNSFENYPMSWKPQRSDLEKPYYISLAARLERDILEGRLPENTKLPPQRELADYLDLNLSTITRAYKLCELKGLLYAVTGKGTFVSPGISARDTFLDKRCSVIEMGMIKPFYECNQSIADAARQVLNDPKCAGLFEYSDPLGTKRQIDAALKWFRRLGIDTDRKNILLSAGAQNALAIILISLFRAGDKIAVDAFTYTNFKGLANFLQIQLIAVDTDESGMSPGCLAQLCKNTEIKGIYLMPTCSNPTSIFMPAQRRQEIAKVADRFGLLVIEDDIYSFLAPRDVNSFFAILPQQTVHVCSISKSLCAGLRVALLAFPDKYRETLVTGMLHINLKTVSLNGEIFAQLVESGRAWDIVQTKTALAKRRDAIFKSVFAVPAADDIARFFYWLPLPGHLTGEEAELLALQKGIHILGSHRFAMKNEQKSSYIRISVTSPDTEEELRRGLLLLKEIFADGTMNFFV